MIFKNNWETSESQHELPKGIVAKMVAIVFPDKKIKSHQLIPGGCANFNIKIELEEDTSPLVLRLYLRDRDAAFREQKIGELLNDVVAVPRIHTVGDVDGYRFSIADFMPGIPLRDFLLSEKQCDIQNVMYEVGVMLSKISEHEFSDAGFFDQNLQVKESIDRDSTICFVKACLTSRIVISELSAETISIISFYLNELGYLFPDKDEKYLVHADFDPANILVNKVEGVWKITAVLDWEFSFSGSVLFDVASMLRYAHHMPPEFESSFIKGLQSGGVILVENWRITTHMLNLVSLLDCFQRSDPKICPNRCVDLRELIEHHLQELNKSKMLERKSHEKTTSL